MEFQKVVISHWGLLIKSPENIPRFKSHLASMVKELTAFVDSLSSAVTVDPDEKKESSGGSSRVAASMKLPFLSGRTFSNLFELLLLLVAGALSVSEADVRNGDTASTTLGPYEHFVFLLGLYSKLVDIYRKRSMLFPSRTASIVFDATRRFLRLVVFKVNQFVAWRISQPLLCV
jgi:hypothetical protein